MINELHSKSLKELRVLYPGVKSNSKDGFISKLPSEGLGDTIEKVLNHPILKPITEIVKKLIWKDGEDCGCEDKRKKWNKEYNYRFRPYRCFTEEEYKEWTPLKKEITLKASSNQVTYVWTLYQSIFNVKVSRPCTNCSPRPLIDMIDKLNIVYDSYRE